MPVYCPQRQQRRQLAGTWPKGPLSVLDCGRCPSTAEVCGWLGRPLAPALGPRCLTGTVSHIADRTVAVGSSCGMAAIGTRRGWD